MQVFRSFDVIVWSPLPLSGVYAYSGIVCTYSTIKPFIEEGDSIRLADRTEASKYLRLKK